MAPKKKTKDEEAAAVPPQWQWLSDDKVWSDFVDADSNLLEKSYNSKTPMLTTDEMSFSTTNKVTFDFKKSVQLNEETKTERPIRRLTLGIWEWKDDHGLFCEFYDEDTATIELNWRKLDGGSGSFSTTKLSFNVGYDSKYTFTFKQNFKGEVSGTQKNEESGTERLMRRRPRVEKDIVWSTEGYGISALPKPVAPPVETASSSGVQAVSKNIFDPPPYWEKQTSPMQKFDVPKGTEEYKRAVKDFEKTLHCAVTIHGVKRIQNEALWRFYALTRHRVSLHNGGNTNEMELFHGARVRQNMDAIENFGFDMRVARDGSAGIGIYFAVNSQYSNGGYVLRHPDNSREMYVCRVAVGNHTQGKHGMKRPPAKTGKKAEKDDLFDSVHNGKPISMYIVFDNNQAYPEYLIHYTPVTKHAGWY